MLSKSIIFFPTMESLDDKIILLLSGFLFRTSLLSANIKSGNTLLFFSFSFSFSFSSMFASNASLILFNIVGLLFCNANSDLVELSWKENKSLSLDEFLMLLLEFESKIYLW